MSDSSLTSWGLGIASATSSGWQLRTINTGEGNDEDEAMLREKGDYGGTKNEECLIISASLFSLSDMSEDSYIGMVLAVFK